MERKDKGFLFSVIVPVYNVEPYLCETVESVISQTAGFEKNIQLILVNDGSTDDSGRLCEEYRSRYPQNIFYIDKKNGGVSSARNAGLEYAEGQFINFLDGDDCWDSRAFEHVLAFFEKNNDINIVTGRFVITGRDAGKKHHLDYKYKQTRVVDIIKSYKLPEMSCSKSFFRAEILKDVRFDEHLSVSEDLLLINTLLLKEKKYGIVKEAEYYYRKREDETSAIDRASQSLSFYTETPGRVFKKLEDLSREKYGKVIPYIQYLVITDLQWRFEKQLPDWLSDEERTAYLADIHDIVGQINDKMILAQRRMSIPRKSYVFRFKYGEEGFFEKDKLRRQIAGSSFFKLRAEILYARDELVIEGRADEKCIGSNYYIYAKDNKGNIFTAEYRPYPKYDAHGMDPGISIEGQAHILRLPLVDHRRYRFFVSDGSNWKHEIKITYGKFSRLTGIEDSFFAADKHIIKQIEDSICVYNRRVTTYMASAFRYNQKIKEKAGKEAVSIRNEAIRRRMTGRKPIWIISDRTHSAKDNGAALFEYLMKTDIKNRYNIYFLLEEDSVDYERLCRIGKVIKYDSREHKVLQLAASMIISSHASDWVINPFGKDKVYYRDLLDCKYAFLQHGITKDDQSDWLHKHKKNISMFVTSTNSEYESIIHGKYGYDDSVVKNTGMARYDKLKNERERIVFIAPTWRVNLAGSPAGGSKRGYKVDFRDSDYYKFYNTLINDERIKDAFRKNGYIGIFCIHPMLEQMAEDFEGNEIISITTGPDYSDMISRCAMLVTDFSSVAFDFAYLYKPVIYSQFDYETFFEGQIYDKGYYDYETDGFGPVCYNYESTVKAVVETVNNDCEETARYAERVRSTFSFTDNNNCKRITEELIKIETNR